jgi:DNA-3-methyladenine glycosylase II
MNSQQRSFFVSPVPPFRLDLTAWALRRRADNAVDTWDGFTYRRALVHGGSPLEIAAAQVDVLPEPRLLVTLTGAQLDQGSEDFARATVTRLLGLDVDLSAFYRLADGDPTLNVLAARFRGLKPPRFPALFECIVNAIACQQLTLTVGIMLLNRLSKAHGTALGDGPPYAFPRPSQLAGLRPEALTELGFSGTKARSIIELAEAIVTGDPNLDEIELLEDADALALLQRLRGVGRWTAEYALLRGLGRLHVFPGDDVGARNNLAHWLNRQGPLDYAGVRAAVQQWQPYAGLVYFHLLLANLEEQGVLAKHTSWAA